MEPHIPEPQPLAPAAEPAAGSVVHGVAADTAHPADEAAHGDAFYALTNPRFLGLPLGVLIAAAVSFTAVCITLLKFVGASIKTLPL